MPRMLTWPVRRLETTHGASGASPRRHTLTKAGHDVTLIDRLSQRVQQRALPAQALGPLLAKRCTPAKIELGSRWASAITSASVPPVSQTFSWSAVRE